jgi:hypothetical protein
LRVTSYLYLLTLNDRKRHEHVTEHGQVVQFAVQYETFVDGEWQTVIRYDTAHGFPHLDKIHPDGSVEKIPLLTKGIAEALSFADQDIDEHWEQYREAYLTGRKR